MNKDELIEYKRILTKAQKEHDEIYVPCYYDRGYVQNLIYEFSKKEIIEGYNPKIENKYVKKLEKLLQEIIERCAYGGYEFNSIVFYFVPEWLIPKRTIDKMEEKDDFKVSIEEFQDIVKFKNSLCLMSLSICVDFDEKNNDFDDPDFPSYYEEFDFEDYFSNEDKLNYTVLVNYDKLAKLLIEKGFNLKYKTEEEFRSSGMVEDIFSIDFTEEKKDNMSR